MGLEKLTEKAREALQQAASEAEDRSQQAIEPEHLLLALVDQQDGIARPLLRRRARRCPACARPSCPGSSACRGSRALVSRTSPPRWPAPSTVPSRKLTSSRRVTDQNPESKYQALERYGRDLTADAALAAEPAAGLR